MASEEAPLRPPSPPAAAPAGDAAVTAALRGPAYLRGVETSPPFGTPQLFLTDSRLVLTVVNHLRYQALERVFGTSRQQANALTVVLLLGAADSAYEAGRRISGTRLRVSDAGLGTIA